MRRNRLPAPDTLNELQKPLVDKVVFRNLPAGSKGIFDDATGVLTLSNSLKQSVVELMNTLVHEVRHAVQARLRKYSDILAVAGRRGEPLDEDIAAALNSELFIDLYRQTRLNGLSDNIGGSNAQITTERVIEALYGNQGNIAGIPTDEAKRVSGGRAYNLAMDEVDAQLTATRFVLKI